ncbi:protein tyrosine phosphatase family protein [Wenzhouxiangella sp. XN24]|uniref:protein tyrosine phosphatase family protein n=1 Tax=Wenzhouxiangella sp. XN24 TaxID=2713569 RepID=UPI0013ECABE3|nr:protein tyrosine phosphatase family protein [Wenzhouxiangella sp. XN24]NGX17152.1 hypothetical protein [Wenzhouxiangella sp. XN24]
MNFHTINDRLVTGGDFAEDGLETIAGRGVTVVIDLRPAPPEGQAQRLLGRGIKWINIPVEWQQPTVENFDEFTAAMQASAGEKVFVQCQANYRASTMTYLYRVKVEGVAEPVARKDLEAAWQPNDTWRAFIRTVLEEGE